MNKKARILLSVLILMMVVLVVAACTGNNNGDTGPATPGTPPPPATTDTGTPAVVPGDAAGPGTRNAQGLRPDVSTNGDTLIVSIADWMMDPDSPSTMVYAIEAFRANHPYINVETQFANIGSDEVILGMIAAGDMPDIFFDIQRPLQFLVTQGWVHPLSQFIEDDDACFAMIPQEILDLRTLAGELWALPGRSHLNSAFIAINVNLMEELNLDMPSPDWTFDEFLDFISAGATDQFAGIQELPSPEFMGVLMTGENLFGFNPQTNTFNLSGGWVSAHQLRAEWNAIPNLVANRLRCPDDPFENANSDYVRKFGAGDISDAHMAFMTGNVLTRTANVADRAMLQENWYLQEADFDVVLHNFPSDPRVGFAPPLHTMSSIMSSTTQHPEAAFELLRWLSYSEPGLRSIIEGFFFVGNTTNPNVHAAFDEFWPDAMTPGVRRAIESVSNGGTVGLFPVVSDYGSIFDAVLQPANESVMDGGDVHALAAEATDRANQMLAEAVARDEVDIAAIIAEFNAR